MDKHVVVSRIKTPDGTILTSRHVHDYVEHTDANGEYYFLDGGNEYCRTSVNKVPAENVSLYDTDPFEEIRKYAVRGTFDKDGHRIFKPICELSNKHLDNIIIYNEERGLENSIHHKLIQKEIEYRKNHNIVIEDDWIEE